MRYREDFEGGLVQLTVARHLLNNLADLSGTSRDQALAVQFADEIGPEIRHCAHEIGIEKSYDIDGIAKQFFDKNRMRIIPGYDSLLTKMKENVIEDNGGQKCLETLMWEGKPVSIRNPELVDVLLGVQEARLRLDGQHKSEKNDGRNGKGNMSKKAVAAYDAILSALSDAEGVARKLSESQQLRGDISNNGHDFFFIHAFIIYQLLSRRIQRDLLLVSSLLSTSKVTSPNDGGSKNSCLEPQKLQSGIVDGRLYPAVVKLLDTVLQSLDQMRSLSIVDDSPDLVSAIEARITYTRARRCLFLARCYVPCKKFAEALTLIHHAYIHIRETTSFLGLIDVNPKFGTAHCFFPLNMEDINDLEVVLTADSLQMKRDWFAYNGGSVGAEKMTYQKLLFFNIALNYVNLDMDQLMRRAGKESATTSSTILTATQKQEIIETKSLGKTRIEMHRSPTPEPPVPNRGALSTLLGGWWGKS